MPVQNSAYEDCLVILRNRPRTMKRSDLIFALLLIPLDFVMLSAAGIAAYFLRFQALTALRPVIFEIPFFQYLLWTAIVAFFYIVVFAFSGLYAIGYRKITNELQRIITACSTGIMLVIVFIFFIHKLFSSRFIILAAWLLSIVFVIIGRMAIRVLRAFLFRKSIGLHPVIVIGEKERRNAFVAILQRNPSWGYRIVKEYDQFHADDSQRLAECISKEGVSELFLLDPLLSHDALQHIIDFATIQHIDIRYAADVISARRLSINMLAGVPFVLIKRTRLEGWGRIIKRLFDCIVAGVLLVTLAPLFAIIAAAIKLDSRGPVIYRNIRVGPHGLFPTYKFRSMNVEYCTGPGYDHTGEAERMQQRLIESQSQRKGPVFKVLRDPRRTRVGRILERTSFDELPQLMNVLRGTMSLVGPRPHMPQEVAGYSKNHHQLFSVKPGITGLAQISGRSDLDFDDEARLDIVYAENWSLGLDCIILLKTPWAVLTRTSRV